MIRRQHRILLINKSFKSDSQSATCFSSTGPEVDIIKIVYNAEVFWFRRHSKNIIIECLNM